MKEDVWSTQRRIESNGAACWVQQAATGVEATVAQIAEWLRVSRLLHADETGMRLCGKLHWMHVASTCWLTLTS
jgi:hypothetical protein